LLQAGAGDKEKDLLGELMDVRQDLGSAYHAVRIWGLGSRIKQIQEENDGMRKYLETVIDGALAGPNTKSHEAYLAFLRWQHEGAYETDFKARYLRAKTLVDPSFRLA
jgi:hypothetical protein